MPVLAGLVFITNINANTNTNTNIDIKVGPQRLQHNANSKILIQIKLRNMDESNIMALV